MLNRLADIETERQTSPEVADPSAAHARSAARKLAR
jgi:hypothetical protein